MPSVSTLSSAEPIERFFSLLLYSLSGLYGLCVRYSFPHARSPSTSDPRGPRSGPLEPTGATEKSSSKSPVSKFFSSSLRSLRALREPFVLCSFSLLFPLTFFLMPCACILCPARRRRGCQRREMIAELASLSLECKLLIYKWPFRKRPS